MRSLRDSEVASVSSGFYNGFTLGGCTRRCCGEVREFWTESIGRAVVACGGFSLFFSERGEGELGNGTGLTEVGLEPAG